MANDSFQPDSRIAEIAEAYALDAVDLAARNFGIALDGSEDSVKKVEEMLGRLHDEMANAQPSHEAIWAFAKSFGSYIGQVLRQHHGGDWGMIRMGEELFLGMRLAGGVLCWPWGRVHNRLVKGREDNVWHNYSELVREAA